MARKRIGNIDGKTELFQKYHWPSNFRELQNVIEKAVILSDGETFSVDERWMQREAHGVPAVHARVEDQYPAYQQAPVESRRECGRHEQLGELPSTRKNVTPEPRNGDGSIVSFQIPNGAS